MEDDLTILAEWKTTPTFLLNGRQPILFLVNGRRLNLFLDKWKRTKSFFWLIEDDLTYFETGRRLILNVN